MADAAVLDEGNSCSSAASSSSSVLPPTAADGVLEEPSSDVSSVPTGGQAGGSRRNSLHADCWLVAEAVYDYEWPEKSADRWFLQEQISEYLEITSFKRKYPELSRRMVEPDEKHWLKLQRTFTDAQVEIHGLTALRAVEVLDLMAQDYPEKYGAYQKVSAERIKESLAAKQREMAFIKSDSRKLEELRRKAIRNTADWNSDLNRERAKERRYFWDVQTMTIQAPKSRYKVLPPSETDPGAYPVALMPGQFSNYYKRLSSESLFKMPLNSVLDTEPLFPKRQRFSPPPITINDEELVALQPAKAPESAQPTTDTEPTTEDVDTTQDINEEDRGEDTGEHCSFCRRDLFSKDRYLQCAECSSCGHPSCLEMTTEIYTVAKRYRWQCIDCKPCSVCANLDEEDKMLFCDRCDRGYHTFCVGLSKAPHGRWICGKFCGGGGAASASGGDSAPQTPQSDECRDCGVVLTRDNKVHHRNKFYKMSLCTDCVAIRTA